MKRITPLIVFIAGGLLATSTPASAQSTTTETPNWLMGHINLLTLGRDSVDSSKFQEYRSMPRGLSMPTFTLQGRQNGKDFAVFGQSISRTDQRYSGRASAQWFGVAFDYNRIPHSMGNDGHSILNLTAPGVWSMSQTLRTSLQTAVDATPTAGRTYAFYSNLYAPTIAAANLVDLNSLRQRGAVEFDLARNQPYDLKVSYLREVKTGTRGPGGGYVRGAVDNLVEIPEPLNEVMQDLGVRTAVNRTWGNLHGGFSYNWYNDRQQTTTIDNPLRPFDLAYVSASVPGGGSQARIINPPDNAATSGTFGALFKFRRQTRLAGDVTLARWTQNAPLYPYTINTTILTGVATNPNAPIGTRADSLDALQITHLDGRVDTTSAMLSFSSRPIARLGVRVRYRLYDQANKTPAFQRLGYVSLDRAWSTASFTTEPLGYPTANPYSNKTQRTDASASYDIGDLTLEAGYRYATIERTYREAEQGTDKGGSVAAILHRGELLRVRGTFDKGQRDARGPNATSTTQFQGDEAARDSTRAGLDVEVTPNGTVTFMVAYLRRHDRYKNPDAVTGVADTAQGFLEAKYDTYTAETDLNPTGRVACSLFYTYEKNLSRTQVFSGGTNLLSRLTFAGSDKTQTYGVNANVKLVPDKWTLRLNARHQKLDGLMDIAGDPGGSFALARATLGGIQNITDYGDTNVTSATGTLEYAVANPWSIGAGYTYYKYVWADAFSAGTLVYPQAGTGFYLKANDRPYTANVFFTYLNYRW